MKILNEVEEIFAKYDLKPIQLPDGYKNLYDYLYHNKEEKDNSIDYVSLTNDTYLNEKYADYIPHGWYGFDIGTPIIPAWMEILDEIVELCTENDQDFEIHQIKLKYGGMRFYVHSDIIEDIHEVEMRIEDKLFDVALIY
jgi:hypothetical protein